MIKNIKKITYFVLMLAIVLTCFSCKKKVKHKWIEIGADGKPVETDSAKITPGVHPERGSDSEATKVIIAPVYCPLGRDKNGVAQYKKILYELEELTPDAIDQALKNIGVIDEASLFCDLVISESDVIVNAGPGATEAQLTKKGTVRYVDLSSSMDNSDEYEGKYYAKDLENMIDQHDIEYCITQTFEENFQLVSCNITPVEMDEYRKVHNQ